MSKHRTITILEGTFHYTGDVYKLPVPIMGCVIEIFYTTPGKAIAHVRDEIKHGMVTIVRNHNDSTIHGLSAIQRASADFEEAIEDVARRFRGYSDYEYLYNIRKCNYLPLQHKRNENIEKWYYALNRTFNIVHSNDKSCWVYEDDDTEYQSPLYPNTVQPSLDNFMQWVASTVNVISLEDDE